MTSTMRRSRLAGIAVATCCVALSFGAVVAQARDSYTFAVIAPMSGDSAAYGLNLQRGTQLAADQINANGGVSGSKLILEFFDSQCLATQAANAASKIVSDPNIFGVLGDVCSVATLAALPIFNRAGISEISGDASSPNITEVVKTKHYTNFARTIPSDAQVAPGMVRLATAGLHKRRLAILYGNDGFGQPLYLFEKEALPSDAELVASETYTPATTKDFTPQLTKIAAAKPDVILIDGYYSDAGTAVSQLPRVGLGGVTIICSPGIDHAEFIKLAGPPSEGVYVFSAYDANNTSPSNTNFVKEFRAKYNTEPNEQAAYGYELPFLMKLAIEKGATKDDLATVVRSLTFVGPSGTTKFDSNGDVLGKTGVVTRVENGAFKFDAAATAAANAK